jgi:hydrogenase expression/formation protein HypC
MDGACTTDSTCPTNNTGGREDECHGDTCITCGDVAVEVTVRRLLADGMAIVGTAAATEEEVSVALVDAEPGDRILVHAREAIAVAARAGSGRAGTGRAGSGRTGEVTT